MQSAKKQSLGTMNVHLVVFKNRRSTEEAQKNKLNKFVKMRNRQINISKNKKERKKEKRTNPSDG